MKNFWLDLCLVLLLMCVISLFFDDYQVSKMMFENSIDEFEQKVSLEEEIEENNYITYDQHDNHISLFLKTIGDGCIVVMKYIVMIFSDFISMIL